MMERTNQSGVRRQENEMLRRMLSGGGARRGYGDTRSVPAMEAVSPSGQMNGNGCCGTTGTADRNGGGTFCSLAMVYSPEQIWQGLYSPQEALREGTLFRELAKPFSGRTISGR